MLFILYTFLANKRGSCMYCCCVTTAVSEDQHRDYAKITPDARSKKSPSTAHAAGKLNPTQLH